MSVSSLSLRIFDAVVVVVVVVLVASFFRFAQPERTRQTVCRLKWTGDAASPNDSSCVRVECALCLHSFFFSQFCCCCLRRGSGRKGKQDAAAEAAAAAKLLAVQQQQLLALRKQRRRRRRQSMRAVRAARAHRILSARWAGGRRADSNCVRRPSRRLCCGPQSVGGGRCRCRC